MATSELTIKITWENAVQFKMTAKNGDGGWKTVAQMDENGHLSLLWASMEELCSIYFKKELEQIGNEMKA